MLFAGVVVDTMSLNAGVSSVPYATMCPGTLQALRLKVLDIRLVPSAALSPHDRPAGHVCLFREISLSKQTSRTQARHGQAVFISG